VKYRGIKLANSRSGRLIVPFVLLEVTWGEFVAEGFVTAVVTTIITAVVTTAGSGGGRGSGVGWRGGIDSGGWGRSWRRKWPTVGRDGNGTSGAKNLADIDVGALGINVGVIGIEDGIIDASELGNTIAGVKGFHNVSRGAVLALSSEAQNLVNREVGAARVDFRVHGGELES